MLQVSEEQVTDLRRRRRKAFIEAQALRLKQQYARIAAERLGGAAAVLMFTEQLVLEGMAAGVTDCQNMEALLDACLVAGWTSPELRVTAGVKRILDDTWMSGTDKVTRLVNAAAFSAASPPLRA